jgi:hypothetical protein
MFALDIDLLTLEPNLFAEVGWSAQRLVNSTGTLSGTTLTIAGADLAAAGVEAGCVVLMNGVPLEVVARTGTTTLTVSLVRWGRSGPAIPPVNMPTGPCDVYTFRQQIAIAHTGVLRLLSVSAGTLPAMRTGSDGPQLGESAIINSAEFATLEALLALHDIYSSAGAAAPGGSPLSVKADRFRRRVADERARCAAFVDTNGDGIADATRRPNVIPLLRG